jgi:site-specific recombinase XerD
MPPAAVAHPPHAAAVPRRPAAAQQGDALPRGSPTIEEIIAVMRHAGDSVHGRRLRGLIVVLWRAGLRICEALALAEANLDPRRGSLLVRRGKGSRRREVGMDDWAWGQLEPWLQARIKLPIGPLFCVVTGATRGRPWAAAAARSELRRVAREAGVRRRLPPHQLRHAHAVEMARGACR